MKNTAQTIEVSGTTYTMTETGYCYSKINGKQKRISKNEWNAAYETYARELARKLDDKATGNNFNRKKRTRRSKDVAFELNGLTLTKKQVSFIKRMPEDCFYENGIESTLWIDIYCDTIADEFNPMSAGAIVSTLKEKGLIIVGQDRINGRKCKSMAFTELGQQVAKELGL